MLEEDPQPVNAPLQAYQLSLLELMFASTLTAVWLGVYLNISKFLALVPAGLLIVFAVVQYLSPQNVILSGIWGFSVAGTVAIVIAALFGASQLTSVAFLCTFPVIGYFIGFTRSIFSDWEF